MSKVFRNSSSMLIRAATTDLRLHANMHDWRASLALAFLAACLSAVLYRHSIQELVLVYLPDAIPVWLLAPMICFTTLGNALIYRGARHIAVTPRRRRLTIALRLLWLLLPTCAVLAMLWISAAITGTGSYELIARNVLFACSFVSLAAASKQTWLIWAAPFTWLFAALVFGWSHGDSGETLAFWAYPLSEQTTTEQWIFTTCLFAIAATVYGVVGAPSTKP